MKAQFAAAELGAGIARLGARFLTWWLSELAFLVPARWRRREPARIEVRQDNDALSLKVVCPPRVIGTARLSYGRLDPADFSNKFGSQQTRLPIWIFPPRADVLSRRVQIPASAVAGFENLLGLEIDRWSPYKLDEVYYAWDEQTSEGSARRDVDLHLIPRSLVDRLCAELSTAGFEPSFLALDAARRHLIDLRTNSSRRIQAGGLLTLAAAILGFLAILTDWIAVKAELNTWRERYRGEMSLLSSQRNLEDRISKAVISVEQTSSVLSKGRLLAALSAALPDTDWLTEIEIKNNSLTLRGYAANLDRLVKALEPMAADQNINLQGEVAFDAGISRQRFTVTFRPSGV